MTTSSSLSSLQVVIPTAPSATTATGALRLGAYRDQEDNWISKSIPVSDGIYLMTNSYATTNVDGSTYIHAGEGMNILGKKTISMTDAGEGSVRAAIVSFAADETPSTSETAINMQASGVVKLESDGDFSINCKNLVYIVHEHFSSSTDKGGVDIAQGEITMTLKGVVSANLMTDFNIATMGMEVLVADQTFAVMSIGAIGIKFTGEMYKSENHGLRAFLVGLLVPFSEADANVQAVSNQNAVVVANDTDIEANEDGAVNRAHAVRARARTLSSHI